MNISMFGLGLSLQTLLRVKSGYLTFTKRFRKIRLEGKWILNFWVVSV